MQLPLLAILALIGSISTSSLLLRLAIIITIVSILVIVTDDMIVGIFSWLLGRANMSADL